MQSSYGSKRSKITGTMPADNDPIVRNVVLANLATVLFVGYYLVSCVAC